MKYRLRSLFALGLSVLLSFSIVLTAQATEADTSDLPDSNQAGESPAADTPDSSADISWPQGPEIEGESGIVMEASTGTVLYDKNMHDQHYPASITKILTVLLALENCSLDEMVTVPYEAAYMPEKGPISRWMTENSSPCWTVSMP